ncbi:hypothetical protein OIU84_026651 [Salix udensis]|uniref:NAD-dependent epimerase/dehydratase domain-containing protein n=1 Tax=Salix udensis TaxID=889485 RepID=A0AAD6KMN3_9ROSI|nr:hypothetical protein OIU84_026651 [Salix udensis]
MAVSSPLPHSLSKSLPLIFHHILTTGPFCVHFQVENSTSLLQVDFKCSYNIPVCITILEQRQSPSYSNLSSFSQHELGVTHILVTGGAGYIGSHAALRLLKDSYRVTIVFIYADLGDARAVSKIFAENAFDAVMHFASVAYVGESTTEPLRYYHNITSNTLVVLEAMAAHKVKTLIYSSTCATYGEPVKMPITEKTPQLPINPYGKAKKMAEDIIIDF